MLNANSIIGTPVKTDDGTTIIPVLKITVGYLGGGGEYGDIKLITKEKTSKYCDNNANYKNFYIINTNGKSVSVYRISRRVRDGS